VVELAANGSQSTDLHYPIDGDPTGGVYVEVVAGTVDGVLFHRA